MSFPGRRARLRTLTALGLAVPALVLATVGTAYGNASQTSETSTPSVRVYTQNSSGTTPGTVYAIASDHGISYVGGDFNLAGPNQPSATPSSTLIAVNQNTGDQITSFNAVTPGPIRALLPYTDSANHRWIFAGGYTTNSAGATTGGWLAKLDAATGANDPNFKTQTIRPTPSTTGQINDLATDGSKLFVAGNFATLGGQPRLRLGAVSFGSGIVSNFRVDVDGPVTRIVVGKGPSSGQLYLAGNIFTHVAGVERHEFASVSTSTGAVSGWNPNVYAQGEGLALSPDGAWAYLSTGNGELSACTGDHEAIIAVPAAYNGIPPHRWQLNAPNCAYNTGDINAVVASPTTVFIGGHLSALAGASQIRRHIAAVDATTGQVLPWAPVVGGIRGVLALALDNPANPSTLLAGGDFGMVGDDYQAGYGQFAITSPDPSGPATPGTPTLDARAARTIGVRWTGSADPSDVRVTYQVYRDGTKIASVPGLADPAASYRYVDSGQTPGTSHWYSVDATDGTTTSARTQAVKVTVPSANTLPDYASQVLGAAPWLYYRFNETAGAKVAADSSGAGRNGSYTAAVSLPGGSAMPDNGGSMNTDGLYTGVSSPRTTAPTSFSIEAWFRTTHPGGAIAGFGNSADGFSSTTKDRLLYMIPTGQLVFGVYPKKVVTLTTPHGYADGAWHHVVASLGPAGMQIFVDGVLVARSSNTAAQAPYAGYWTFGGTTLNHFVQSGSGSTDPWPMSFVGGIDDVAIYNTQLPASYVAAHYAHATSGGSRATGSWGGSGARGATGWGSPTR